MKRTNRVPPPHANVTPSCDLSKMLVNHLQRIGGFHESVATVDYAVEKLFTLEAEAFSSLIGHDDIYPSAMVAFGAEFVARAFDVLVRNPPRAARKALVHLLNEIRSEMQERITFAIDEVSAAAA